MKFYNFVRENYAPKVETQKIGVGDILSKVKSATNKARRKKKHAEEPGHDSGDLSEEEERVDRHKEKGLEYLRAVRQLPKRRLMSPGAEVNDNTNELGGASIGKYNTSF